MDVVFELRPACGRILDIRACIADGLLVDGSSAAGDLDEAGIRAGL